MKIQRHVAALLVATTLFAACIKKDKQDKEDPNNATNCKIAKAFLYKGPNNAPIIDTLTYTYTNSMVAKIAGPDYYITFEYSGGRITRCNYVDSLAATALTDYETAAYNSDGTVSQIEKYSAAQLKDQYQFTYNAGKLTKLSYTSYKDGVASGYADTHFYSYTGSNITRDSVIRNDPHRAAYNSVYYYTYDHEENYFGKEGTNALFNSALSMNFDADIMPFLFSANNVAGFREDPNGEIADYTYITDRNNHLTMMKIFDVPVFAWAYPCQ